MKPNETRQISRGSCFKRNEDKRFASLTTQADKSFQFIHRKSEKTFTNNNVVYDDIINLKMI